MEQMMSMMNGPMMGAMMLGGGLVLLLILTLLTLSVMALIKYLRSAT
jgi:hypothetical protein|tara:strand:- start:53 stop:193 length:141 start_codon:yes stop_codon:yes gene_type:complete